MTSEPQKALLNLGFTFSLKPTMEVF